MYIGETVIIIVLNKNVLFCTPSLVLTVKNLTEAGINPPTCK